MAKGAKWLSLLGAVALALASAATAAAGGPGAQTPRDPKARVERMKERLGLTDDQARRIEGILAEAMAQGHSGGEATRERRRRTHEQIQAVLTEEQKARAADLRREHRRGGRPRPAASPQP